MKIKQERGEKKMKSNLLKKIVPGVLALAMVVSLAVPTVIAPSFAQNDATPKLVIKKVLTIADKGVTTPEVTFKFNSKLIQFNQQKEESELKSLPQLTAGEVVYKKTDNQDDMEGTSGRQIIKGTSNLLPSYEGKSDGQYVYEITESQDSLDKGSESGMVQENYVLSKAKYTVSVFVSGGKADKILIKRDLNDNGETPSGDQKKTLYTPGSEADKYKDNGLKFENSYEKKAGNPNPSGTTEAGKPNDQKGFVITKAVTGDNASETQEFDFQFTISKPSISKATEFKYRVLDKNGNVKGATENNQDIKTGEYDKPQSVKLAHGERVVLADVVLGSTAKVTETNAHGYTSTVKAVNIGADVTDTRELANNGITLSDNDKGNYADFTNQQQDATGILLNNLPYILLIILAAAGILFYARKRRSEEEYQA